jgi:hypothetical protein
MLCAVHGPRWATIRSRAASIALRPHAMGFSGNSEDESGMVCLGLSLAFQAPQRRLPKSRPYSADGRAERSQERVEECGKSDMESSQLGAWLTGRSWGVRLAGRPSHNADCLHSLESSRASKYNVARQVHNTIAAALPPLRPVDHWKVGGARLRIMSESAYDIDERRVEFWVVLNRRMKNGEMSLGRGCADLVRKQG